MFFLGGGVCQEQGQWVMPDVSKLLEAMGSMSPTSPTEDGTRPAYLGLFSLGHARWVPVSSLRMVFKWSDMGSPAPINGPKINV